MISDFRFSSPLRRSFRACRSSSSGSGALSIASHTNVAAASTARSRSVIVGASKGFPCGGDGGGDNGMDGGNGLFRCVGVFRDILFRDRRAVRDFRYRGVLLYRGRSYKDIFAI